MKRPPRPPDRTLASRTRPGATCPCPEDSDSEVFNQLRAYLECRCRRVAAPPALAEAWDDFYEFFTPRISAFLGRYRLQAADREDCLQEVWKEVVARLGHLPYDARRARLSTWLTTLARRRAADVVRQSRRIWAGLDDAFALVDPGPDAGVECERLWERARVTSLLTELSGQASAISFQVFYLRWIGGRPISDIAHSVDLTPAQVRFRLCRMKRKFRDLLERSIGAHLK
jgi:RNA polymerase sigma-70 factor (ECF subfamily)